MVKHIQTIRRLLPSELAHFVGLALKELILEVTFDNNPLRNWYQIILLKCSHLFQLFPVFYKDWYKIFLPRLSYVSYRFAIFLNILSIKMVFLTSYLLDKLPVHDYKSESSKTLGHELHHLFFKLLIFNPAQKHFPDSIRFWRSKFPPSSSLVTVISLI